MSYSPSNSSIEKSARLSCRISPVVKEQAEAAARYLGKSITDFTEAALEEKSKAVMAESERIVFSERAFNDFLVALSAEPPAPSKKLLAAIEQYNRHEPVVERKL